jgi:hypothetical protein
MTTKQGLPVWFDFQINSDHNFLEKHYVIE